ncbi:MAG: Lin0512 family protein [Pseudomonadota bacterium]
MTKTRLLTEFGMGTSLRRDATTDAALRALKDALWHNSINLAEHFGCAKEDMLIDVEIGVPDPETVDRAPLKAAFPYGKVTITCRPGGLAIPKPGGGRTLIANAAINVSLDLDTGQ